jgi:hypothetical protein
MDQPVEDNDVKTRLLKIRDESDAIKRLIEYTTIRNSIRLDRRLLWEAVRNDDEAVTTVGGLEQLCHDPGWEQIRQEYTDTSEQKKDSSLLIIEQAWGKHAVAFFRASNDLPEYLQILPLGHRPLHSLEQLSALVSIDKSVALINRTFVNRLETYINKKSWRGLQCRKPSQVDLHEALKSHEKVTLVQNNELQRLKEAGMPLEIDPVTGLLAAQQIVKVQHKDQPPAWPRFVPEDTEVSDSVESGVNRTHMSSDAADSTPPSEGIPEDESNDANEGSMRRPSSSISHTY